MHSHGTEDQSKLARISRNKDWLPLGAILTEHVNRWASSRDLVLYIGMDGAKDLGEEAATAFYDPRTREIEISAPFAFGKGVESSMINFEDCRTKKGLGNYAVLGGLLLHESMHAKHSTWSNLEIAKALVKAYGKNTGEQLMKIHNLLEELRIESRGVREWERDKGFLRASARKLAAPAPTPAGEPEEKPNLVTALLLVLGREPIKVLTARDVHKLKAEVVKMLSEVPSEDETVPPTKVDGKAVYKAVMEEILDFSRISDRSEPDQEDLIKITKNVYDLLTPYMPKVSMPWDGHGEEPQSGEGEEGGEGQDGDGDGQQTVASPDGKASQPGSKAVEGTENNGELSDEASSAMDETFDSAELGGADDVWEESAREEREKQAREAEQKAKQEKEHEKVSKNTFERSSGQNGKTRSRIVSQRPPTPEEMRAMVAFNTALLEAKHRDRKSNTTRDYVPPGRLQTGAALRDEAIRWAGGAGGSTLMFKGKRRRHVDDPDLIVGQICDISGSMSGTMEPMAVSTWIMANSVNRIEGSTYASVYYGESVFPTLWPGEKLEKVTRYDASDGFEEFNQAFQAIDGKLNLLNGSGVRLLVITSDGNYRPHEEKACRKWLSECQKAGVGVLWLGLKHGRAESFIEEMGAGGEFVDISGGVLEATSAISSAALRALRGY